MYLTRIISSNIVMKQANFAGETIKNTDHTIVKLSLCL